MNIIKKYTAIKITTQKIDDTVELKMIYGPIEGPYYSRTYPNEEFNTEEEAIKYAYETDKWGKWLITPIVKFDNY